MNFSYTTNQIVLLIGAAQGFVLGFALLSLRRKNKIANRLLAALLIVFSSDIVLHTFSHGSAINLPHDESVISITFLLLGPLLFFYVKAITTSSFVFVRKDSLHLLPFFLLALISVPFYLQSVGWERPHIVIQVISVIIEIDITVYMLAAIKILLKHSRSIKESFSSVDKINLRWLRFFITGFTITLLASLLFDIVPVLIHKWDYVWMMVSLFMYLIGYAGLKQPEIFSGSSESFFEEEQIPKKKYEKSTLTSEAAEKNFEKLICLMTGEKPFLNSGLTLPELANKLSLQVHHLSQIINEKQNQNFFEFINSYRVEEAKRLLVDSEHRNLNIVSIGYEAGFNSVSSFNSAFKKYVKMTPSQFRSSKVSIPK
jgi:AraC-like DNA-binding protein